MAKRKYERQECSSVKLTPRVPWVYALLALVFFSMFYGQILSGDIWWQLKTGQWITQHHALPYQDPFSYTSRSPIVFQEWGAEVLAWLIYSKISPLALAILAVALISGAFYISYQLALVRSRSVLSSFIVVALGACASAGASEMRPQMYSYLLFALVVFVLHRYQEQRYEGIWLVPLIFLIWANLHGVFIIGLALIALDAIICLLTPPDWALEHSRPGLAAAGPLAAVGIISAITALINPNGIALYEYPIRVMGDPNTPNMLVEWSQPSFQEWSGRALLAIFALAVLSLAMMHSRPKLRDFVYFALFAAAALIARRQVVLFCIACAAPITLWLSSAIESAGSWLTNRGVRALAWVVLISITATLFAWRVSDCRNWRPFDYMASSDAFPAAACDYIATHNISGPIFNDINYGGYIIWRLGPKHKTLIDTRYEPFLGEVINDYLSAAYCTSPGSWQGVFNKYGINCVMVDPLLPIASMLNERGDWTLAYKDDIAVVFVRDNNRQHLSASLESKGQP